MIYLHKSLLEYAISQAIIFVAFALGTYLIREFLEYHSTRILLLFSFALVGLGSGLSCYLSELYPHQLFGFLSGFIFYSQVCRAAPDALRPS